MTARAPGGVHAHGQLRVPLRTRRLLATAAAVLAVTTVVGMVVLRARQPPVNKLREVLTGRFVDGSIEVVDHERLCPGAAEAEAADPADPDAVPIPEIPGDPMASGDARCPQALVRVLEGPDAGKTVFVDLPIGTSPLPFRDGEKIVLAHTPEADPAFRYSFADRQRKPVLFWLAVAFAAVVVLLGWLRGLTALVGLASSLVVLLAFVLPAILDGRDPLLVAIVGASAIAFLALYLAHGLGAMTTVALLGTLGSLAVTAVLALLVTRLAALTGYADEEASIIQLADARLDLRGLVLAGIVIGALGAIDDMTVTQVAAVGELHGANRRLPGRELYRAGLRIGRDHVASTVNTLALAYAGASIPLLLLFVLSRQPLADVVNGEVVATEVVRTLVGSIGLVCSVPLTTWLAVRVLRAPGEPD